MITRVSASLLVVCMLAGTASAADDEKAAYEARLKAGREAAYKKYLIQAPAPQTAKPQAATALSNSAKPQAAVYVKPGASYIFANRETPFAFGDQRYNYYDNLNVHRQQRWTDYPLAPYIYQPLWDWRYRRSWPRPVVAREYVKSHWLWDGQRYTYVPGHVEYSTHWVVQGWPRYHWRGSHYSVSVSFNR